MSVYYAQHKSYYSSDGAEEGDLVTSGIYLWGLLGILVHLFGLLFAIRHVHEL